MIFLNSKMPIYQYDWAAVIAEVKAIIKVLNIVFHIFGTVSSYFFFFFFLKNMIKMHTLVVV